MREIRQSGSEGGGSRNQSALPTPIRDVVLRIGTLKKDQIIIAGQLLLVATPGSEPGGVGSIPTPAASFAAVSNYWEQKQPKETKLLSRMSADWPPTCIDQL